MTTSTALQRQQSSWPLMQCRPSMLTTTRKSTHQATWTMNICSLRGKTSFNIVSVSIVRNTSPFSVMRHVYLHDVWRICDFCSQSSWPAQTQQGAVGGEDSSLARRAQGHDEVTSGTHVHLCKHVHACTQITVGEKQHLPQYTNIKSLLSLLLSFAFGLSRVEETLGHSLNSMTLKICSLNVPLHCFVLLKSCFQACCSTLVFTHLWGKTLWVLCCLMAV